MEFLSLVKKSIISMFLKLLPENFHYVYHRIRKENLYIDRSEIILFTSEDLLPDYNRRVKFGETDLLKRTIKVSLITTCLNEEKHIQFWLDSVVNQTRQPDEVVIVDGGSQDKTLELIQDFTKKVSFPVKVIQQHGANIAQGRNIAIRNSSYQIIACSDIGTVLDPNWLLYLVAPFEIDAGIKISFGFTHLAETSSYYGKFFIPQLRHINPQTFLPSSRSIAFYKSIWEEVEGYPEWLRDAGEDTFFDFMLKRLPVKWAFVPQAIVNWYGPETFYKTMKTLYRYSFGDGETGLFASAYWAMIKKNILLLLGLVIGSVIWLSVLVTELRYWAFLSAGIIGILAVIYPILRGRKNPFQSWKTFIILRAISFSKSLGFIRGALDRPKAELRRAGQLEYKLEQFLRKYKENKGVVIYLPTHDWGFMFQRPQQMARAFARQGFLWFYCTNNEKIDNVSSFFEAEERLIICNVPIQIFRKIKKPIVYVGASSLISQLSHFDHPYIIYDHYDDLSVSSGRKEDHIKLLHMADIVIVTAQRLYQAVCSIRPDALLIPNGVDYKFITSIRETQGEAPEDMKKIIALKKPIIGYSGAIAEWFDYDLLSQVATQCPYYEFVLIGVNYDQTLDKSNLLSLPNVHWLGMKDYRNIFAYILHFDVAIIPFKVNNITLSTSPIKLFEYAACQKPIVSTQLPECMVYPEVFIADGAKEFIEALEKALTLSRDVLYQQKLVELAQNNSWEIRVSEIISKTTQGIKGNCWKQQGVNVQEKV